MDRFDPHPASSAALELLQVRAIAFRDQVFALLNADADEREWPEHTNTESSAADLASRLLHDISLWDARRSNAPDWYGPVEQLTFQVSFLASQVLDEAERICSEVEAHRSHSYPCRCYELLDFLTERLDPALAEWKDLSKAIEQLRRP